jgi:hypothetical protein
MTYSDSIRHRALAILVLLPPVYVSIFVGIVLSLQRRVASLLLNRYFALFATIHVVVAIISQCLMVWFSLQVARRSTLSITARVVWILGFAVAALVTLPLYFFTNRASFDAQHTRPQHPPDTVQ